MQYGIGVHPKHEGHIAEEDRNILNADLGMDLDEGHQGIKSHCDNCRSSDKHSQLLSR